MIVILRRDCTNPIYEYLGCAVDSSRFVFVVDIVLCRLLTDLMMMMTSDGMYSVCIVNRSDN